MIEELCCFPHVFIAGLLRGHNILAYMQTQSTGVPVCVRTEAYGRYAVLILVPFGPWPVEC